MRKSWKGGRIVAKKKILKGLGLPAILRFLRKGKLKEKAIRGFSESPTPISQTNLNAQALHPKTQHGKLISVTPLGKKAFLYTFEASSFAYFRAGQYVNVHLRDEIAFLSRPISIVSSPKEALEGKLSLAIATNPSGYFAALAPKLMKEGCEIELSGPTGDFYYSPNRDEGHVIACAGGMGITPFISMARAIAEGSEDFKLTILYGVKDENDAVFAPFLGEISAKSPKIAYRIFCQDKGQLITKEDILEAANGKPYSLFVCGPQGMYTAFDHLQNELGLDAKHYRKEIFGSIRDIENCPGYPGADRPIYPCTVHILDKTFEIQAYSHEPILYALERVGIASPSRCRGGICGYCRGKIISGKVFVPQQNDGRREEDKKMGYAHLCMTYPLSALEIEIPAP